MGPNPFLYLFFNGRLFIVIAVFRYNRLALFTAGLTLWLSLLWSTGIALSQTLIAFGDSLTEGCGVSQQGCDGWDAGDYSYPVYLEALFKAEGREITVKNFGKGGETTSEGVNRLETVLKNACNAKIDYVLLLHGTNDLFHHTDPEVVYFNLGVMIDKIRARGIQPVLATITPDEDNDWKEIDRTNDLIRRLAVDKDVLFVDQYNVVAQYWYWYTHPGGCFGDLLHPNQKGFYAIAAAWHEAIPKPPASLPWLMLLLNTP